MKQRFSERYALARIRDEGILLDLETGSYFAVQGSALVLCSALVAQGSVSSAARRVSEKFEVSRTAAARDVAAFLASLRRTGGRARSRAFRERASGFELRGEGDSTLTIARDGTLCAPRASSHLLRVAAPHVLALRGETVLHASAILHRGASIAFVAASGTGKTTIGGILGKNGGKLLSEDLVVLDRNLRVRHDGEPAIRAWARKKAIARHPLEKSKSSSSPLVAVMLVERAPGLRRARIERAERTAAMAALFANAFIELPLARVWTQALDVSRKLVARRIVYTMQVPEGRRALSHALRDWSERGFPTP